MKIFSSRLSFSLSGAGEVCNCKAAVVASPGAIVFTAISSIILLSLLTIEKKELLEEVRVNSV